MSLRGRLLGIDYGRARIGLAVSAPDTAIAFPLTTYERRSLDQDLAYLARVATEEKVIGVVLGLPLHLEGKPSTAVDEVRAFGEHLQTVLKVPLVYWDERFTTVEAEKHLWNAGLSHKQRKARRDRIAAQILLQDYLERGGQDEPAPTEAPAPE